jgi:hypothetical protein
VELAEHGVILKYLNVSCIQPIIHFMPKPMPLPEKWVLICGQSEASSAMVCDIRKITVQCFIQILDKSNRFKVSVPAKFIGFPLAFIPAVIQTQHGRNSIYP